MAGRFQPDGKKSNAMVLQFRCPNGHKIHCPDDWAGRGAKCPKCGVKFRIPQTSSQSAEDEAGNPLTLTQEAGSVASSIELATVAHGPITGPGQIEFLCPSGHHVHCAEQLQGKPGRCPECGVKFRIPIYHEPEAGETDSGLEAQASSSTSGLSWDVLGQEPQHAPGFQPGAPNGQSAASNQVKWHPVGRLVMRLWPANGPLHGVELFLVSGERLVPRSFDARASTPELGVFTLRDQDDESIVVVVPWEAVESVRISGLEKLPPDLVR